MNPSVHDPQSCHPSFAADSHGLVDGRISTIGGGAAQRLEDGPAGLGVRLAGDDAALAVGAVAREVAFELDAGVALAAVQGLGHDVSDVLGAEVEAEDDGGLDAKDALQDCVIVLVFCVSWYQSVVIWGVGTYLVVVGDAAVVSVGVKVAALEELPVARAADHLVDNGL